MARGDGKKPNKRMPAAAQVLGKPFADSRALLPDHHTSSDRICWRFSRVDNDGPWGLKALDQAALTALLDAICKFESMKIGELFHSGGYPGKDYEVAKLPTTQAHTRLDAIGLPDMTKIWALRPQGEPRLWGFLVNNVFHVVWWDPKHEVWPSNLKHT
jgi:hypothetical protein